MTQTASPTVKAKIYFPNLNGLRFIAAMFVIIHHIEAYKTFFNWQENRLNLRFVELAGPLGVILFFVLSGFLITYLLLAEEKNVGEINIRKFYIRRMLRIWPLYFFILTLAFIILPNISIFTLPHYSKEVIYSGLFLKILLYTLFLPNLACVALSMIPYASHTWSIGTEEQFYLIWPILLQRVKKHRILLMAGIVISYLAVSIILNGNYIDGLPKMDTLRSFWSYFNIDCMAIGGIFALLHFQENRFLIMLRNNTLFYVIITVTVLLLSVGYHFRYFHNQIYAVLFGIIILNFATNDSIKISLENKVMHYLGSISYGLYMYHPIAIILAFAIGRAINTNANWVIYPLTILFTIGIAAISYRYFESFFLKLKDKFSNIVNRAEKNN